MRNSELKKQQQEQKKDNKNYDEDKDKQNENIVSKVVSQVGDMVKQVKEPVPSKGTSEST